MSANPNPAALGHQDHLADRDLGQIRTPPAPLSSRAGERSRPNHAEEWAVEIGKNRLYMPPDIAEDIVKLLVGSFDANDKYTGHPVYRQMTKTGTGWLLRFYRWAYGHGTWKEAFLANRSLVPSLKEMRAEFWAFKILVNEGAPGPAMENRTVRTTSLPGYEGHQPSPRELLEGAHLLELFSNDNNMCVHPFWDDYDEYLEAGLARQPGPSLEELLEQTEHKLAIKAQEALELMKRRGW